MKKHTATKAVEMNTESYNVISRNHVERVQRLGETRGA